MGKGGVKLEQEEVREKARREGWTLPPIPGRRASRAHSPGSAERAGGGSRAHSSSEKSACQGQLGLRVQEPQAGRALPWRCKTIRADRGNAL